MQSTTDAEEWNLEVERVAPQLKVTVRVDARDWRTHLEQVWIEHTCIPMIFAIRYRVPDKASTFVIYESRVVNISNLLVSTYNSKIVYYASRGFVTLPIL